MKHASDDMDYDDRRRLVRIVMETCTETSLMTGIKLEGEQLGKFHEYSECFGTRIPSFSW